jgi:hypothetical protein
MFQLRSETQFDGQIRRGSQGLMSLDGLNLHEIQGSELNDDLSCMFSSPVRDGDGCNPFKRYEACNDEYQEAVENLIDSKGNSRQKINVHALICCLETYKNV